jgi:hypothetical protein
MTFDIEINGRARVVSVERAAAGRYRVTVDGTPHLIDAERVGSFGLSLLMDGGVSRDVQIAPGGAPGEMLVRLDGRTAAGPRPTVVRTPGVNRRWSRQCQAVSFVCWSPGATTWRRVRASSLLKR